MPLSESDIQAAIDKIDNAIAAGAVLASLTFADQTFTFRSIDDMLKARAHFASLLAVATTSTSGYRLAATSKGA